MQTLKTLDTGTTAPDPQALSADELELARLIVGTLNIEDAKPEDVDPQAPLYREGLGLDSIDILEIALVMSKRYGFKLRDDDQENLRIFRSLRSLAAHIRRGARSERARAAVARPALLVALAALADSSVALHS